MNWWGRRAGYSILLLLFLLSCEEDISTIGIKNPDGKFRVNYAEIDIPSSVVLFEKLATYNSAVSAEGIQRFLVGQYQDDKFGSVRAEVYTQISPSIDNSLVTAGAVLDSLVLQLKIDFYQYGSRSVSYQTIQIHELSDTINQVIPYNSSKIPYEPKVIGEQVIKIDPLLFEQKARNNTDNVTTNDTTASYRIHLDANFAQRLFDTFLNDASITSDFTKFTGKHKGLAIIPTTSDKILGINPIVDATSLTKATKLTMYYTESGVRKEINFVLYPFTNNPVIGFSSVESNRVGTALQSLTESYKEFFPADNKRYVQSGTGILTKLDFTNFFKYMDTVSNPILNSAELVIENEASDFAPPSAFQFRALNDENKYKLSVFDSLVEGETTQFIDPELYQAYQLNASTLFNTNGTIDIRGDVVVNSPLYASAGTTNSISAYVTEFFQAQYAFRENKKRINYCSVHPRETEFRKSVNRLELKNSVKLKIYYTTPVVETNE